MFKLAILLLATSECCFAYQRRGGQIKIPVDEIDSTTTPKSTTKKRTTTPKPTTQAKKILSSEEIIQLVNEYRAALTKDEIFVGLNSPLVKVMFEVKNDDSLKDYVMPLVYCKPVELPDEYSYFAYGFSKTGAALVREVLEFLIFGVLRNFRGTYTKRVLEASSLLYYKSTRAYCFMQLQSCSPRTNVWLNMVACVFNNRPDAGEQLYIPTSHKEQVGKGCAGNDAICQRAIKNPASWCNQTTALCVAAEGVTFAPKPCSGGGRGCSKRVCILDDC
ncbi:hypothetical protein Q1695_008194 [Nippostrongylus brasiliensis]|nr:hypothetical protein Q1695_008194 [Nippostrongylus brasiliensis]